MQSRALTMPGLGAEMTSSESNSSEPSDRTKRLVWAAAAGRCTFCNTLLTGNEDLGLSVPIGELAHNVGRGTLSPRGNSALNDEERRSPDNLLLLCRNCHKPADAGGYLNVFTVERLRDFKREHEERIRFLTAIGADKTAAVIRVVGAIRGSQPELTYDTVLGATVAAGFFPKLLPGCITAEYEVDLRSMTSPGTPAYFEGCAREVRGLIDRVQDGIRRDAVRRLAVFGFARIPILVYLGSFLDDKIPTLVFQRQRVDDANAWRWPSDEVEPARFDVELVKNGTDPSSVSLMVNLSGTVHIQDLPTEVRESNAVYALRPIAPCGPGVSLIASLQALSNFAETFRSFLANIEANHREADCINLFAAVPVSVAITMGRVLMPNVSPVLRVFDRDDSGAFFVALEVQKSSN